MWGSYRGDTPSTGWASPVHGISLLVYKEEVQDQGCHGVTGGPYQLCWESG